MRTISVTGCLSKSQFKPRIPIVVSLYAQDKKGYLDVLSKYIEIHGTVGKFDLTLVRRLQFIFSSFLSLSFHLHAVISCVTCSLLGNILCAYQP